MKKIFFWFAVFVMSMLVMVQPARASGTVAGTGYYYNASGSSSCPSSQHFFSLNALIGCLQTAYPTYNPISIYSSTHLLAVNGTYIAYGSQTGTCPANSTGTVSCTCNTGFIPNVGATACVAEVVCPVAGIQHSKGFYNVGTVPTGKLMNAPCVSGCKVELFSGVVPAAKQKINGIYYYYGSAEYKHTGAICSPDTPNFLADFVGTLPSATCAVGQQMISMNGVTKCFNSDGTEASANSASAVAAAKTLADAKIAAQIAAAASAVAAAGGSASDVAAAQTVAAGVAAGQASGATVNSSDPVQAAFCADNPDSPMCKAQNEGARTVGAAALDGLYTDGELIAGKTVSSVIGGFKTRVLSSGVGSAIGGFFTVNQAAGTCPVWSVNAPLIGSLTFDFYCQSTFQNLLPWIRSVLLLIFSVIAFRIAVL